MRSRPWIVIVVIGVLGVAALGLVTHFALENNRSLQEVGSFKTALLERYRDRGVEEVSYRVEHRRGEARSVALHLVTRRADLTSRDRIHSDIGEFFITEFPRATSKLRLRWSQPSFWGLFSNEPFLEVEFSAAGLRDQVALRAATRALEEVFVKEQSIEVVTLEAARPRFLVQVIAPRAEKNPAPLLDQIGDVMRRELHLWGRDRLSVELVRRRTREAPAVAPADSGGKIAHAEESGAIPSELEVIASATFDPRGTRVQPGT